MLLRHALIRAGFAYHRLLTLSMAYVARLKARNFSQIPKLPENPLFRQGAAPKSGVKFFAGSADAPESRGESRNYAFVAPRAGDFFLAETGIRLG